jgi:hypothetical protein
MIKADAAGSTPGTWANPSSSEPGTDPKPGETWVDFQWRLYKTHLEQVWTGSVSITNLTVVTTLTFDWLYAATTYQLSGYLDNLNRSVDPTVYTENFTTAAIADCQPFTVSFPGDVPQSYDSVIATQAAYVQGVNPLRLGNGTYSQVNRRILSGRGVQTSTFPSSSFTYTLLPNRFSESPDPVNQARITGAALATFSTNLAASGIALPPTVLNSAVPVRTIPQWTVSPTSRGSSLNTATVAFLADTIGQVCCAAGTENVIPATAEQVMLGLDSTNQAVSSACTQSNLTATYNSVEVSGLQSSTTYYVFCTAMDDYPLWPTQMDESQKELMVPVVIKTLEEINTTQTRSNSAGRLGGLLLMAALLIY